MTPTVTYGAYSKDWKATLTVTIQLVVFSDLHFLVYNRCVNVKKTETRNHALFKNHCT